MSRSLAGKLALACVVATLCVMEAALASMVTSMDLETLVRLSSVIVRGEVESIRFGADSAVTQIHTFVTIRIDEAFKGASGLDRITLKQLGGTVGAYTSVVFGMPEFQTGERVVVFAQPLENGPLTVTGLFQGKYRIDLVGGVEVALGEAARHGTVVVGQAGREPTAQPLAGFLGRVRELVKRYPAHESASQFASFTSASAGAVVLEERTTSFALLNPRVRWHEADSGTPVAYRFNPADAPAVVSGGTRNAFITALAAWTNVTGASIILADGGDTTAACSTIDGINKISHGDPCNQIPTFDSATCRGTVAIGGPTSMGDPRTVNGVAFSRIIEGDVVFNSGADCFWSHPRNYEETMGHELGHTVGLDHSCVPPACAGHPLLDDALMRGALHGDGRGASPRRDDVLGLRFIYPPAGFVDAFLNGSAFRTGQTMNLTVDVNGTAVADVYIAIVLPDGTFFTLGPGFVPSAPNRIIRLAPSPTLPRSIDLT